MVLIRRLLRIGAFVFSLTVIAVGPGARAQCPEKPPLQNFTGPQQVPLPNFIPGEEVGAIFTPPAGDFPLEVLRVGIGWASQFGGNPAQLEQAIHVYGAGLPNPGAPVFTHPGPTLVDGAINVFDFEPAPGQIILNSSPFAVTLELLNQSSGNPFASSVVHDNNGCLAGSNLVFVIPGGWIDACLAGVTGDFVFFVVYRPLNCGPGSVPPDMVMNREPTGKLELTWNPSCSGAVSDYEVYEGALSTFFATPPSYSHDRLVCTTGAALTATVTPTSGDRYYVVVPTDGVDEGSYGRSTSTERPQGGIKCKSSKSIGCP